MSAIVRKTTLLTLGALLAGCAGETGRQKPLVAEGSDLGSEPIPSGRDTGRLGDAAPTDARPVDAQTGAQFGQRCTRNEQCESGWCIQVAAGQPAVCSTTCLDQSSCPDGWSCRVVANTPPDVVSVCFPPVAADAGHDAQVTPDGQLPDAHVPDAHVPDARLADARLPADAAPLPDMSPPVNDMRLVLLDGPPPPPPDMAVVAQDAAPPPPPDMRTLPPPPADMAVVPPDGPPPPPPDMATQPPPPPVDMALPPPPDMAPPPPDMAPPPPLKGYGEECNAGAQCQSGLCVGDPNTGLGMCTQRCVGDNLCPGLDLCRATGNGFSVCFRNETGHPCNLGGDCADGICLTPPDPGAWANPQSICVNRCNADSKCPAGYTCEVIQTNTGPVRACNVNARRLDTCPGGFIDNCLGSGVCVIPAGRQAIDIYQCIGTVDQPEGYCSCSCRNAGDCPAGFGCYREPRAVVSGDATRPGLCLAFAGYRCPVEASHPGNAAFEQCPSFTCVTPDSGAMDAYCSSPCLNDLDCPAEYLCDLALGGCVPAL